MEESEGNLCVPSLLIMASLLNDKDKGTINNPLDSYPEVPKQDFLSNFSTK